jgi:hypothetical protein
MGFLSSAEDLVDFKCAPPDCSGINVLVLMILPLLLRFSAVNQHLFYSSYDGKEREHVGIQQLWGVRIGTALSFLVEAPLNFTRVDITQIFLAGGGDI